MRRRQWDVGWAMAIAVLAAGAGAVACGGGERRVGARPDTVVFGVDRGEAAADTGAAGESLPPDGVRRADERGRLLLERLLDQYAGVGFLLEDLEDSASGELARRAFRHEREEDAHERILLTLLRERWGERYVPSVPPAYTELADSIRRLPPERRDAALTRQLLAAHRRGLHMLDSARPSLAGTDLERPLRELSDDLVDEISELEDRLELP